MENIAAALTLITAMLVVWNAIQTARAVRAAAVAAKIAANTENKVQQLAITVDGRLTQLLEVTKAAALAEGRAEGVASGQPIALPTDQIPLEGA